MNFYHILSLWEAWRENDWKRALILEPAKMEFKDDIKILGVGHTLYTLTEIFEFAKRLFNQNSIGQNENIMIDLKLHDLYEREIVVDSPERTPLFYLHKCHEDYWSWEKTYQHNEIINSTSELALEAFADLLRIFQIDNPPINSFRDERKKLLNGIVS